MAPLKLPTKRIYTQLSRLSLAIWFACKPLNATGACLTCLAQSKLVAIFVSKLELN